jgi:hypothetical protein
LLALLTSGVNAAWLECDRGIKTKNGWVAVVQHMKIIGLSVGLLLALSGLASFAASHRQPPERGTVSPQTAQGGATALRKIAVSD